MNRIKHLGRIFTFWKGNSLDSETGPGEQKVTLKALLLIILFLALLWIFDLFVLHTPILTPFVDRGLALKPLTPIYSFWKPVLRPEAIGFLFASALCLLFTYIGLKTDRLGPLPFAVGLFFLFCALAGTLYLVREDLPLLGQNLSIYPKEELYYDAVRIDNVRDFLKYYDRLQPQLSMRGQHYPPGGAVFLYVLAQCFGEGLWNVGAVVLLLAGAGVVVCYAAARQIVSEVQARQAALLLTACPSLLDFACTSMDAVFFFFAGLCLWSSFMLAKRQESRQTLEIGCIVLALLTGLFLYAACFLTFAAFPLGMCLALFLLFNGRKRKAQSLILIALVGAGFLLTFLAMDGLWGYSLFKNLGSARRHSPEFMSRVLKRAGANVYFYVCFGNSAAFLIGSGIALTGAAFASARRSLNQWTPWMAATALSLLVMVIGWMSTMETERTWLFAMPWIAVFAVCPCRFRAHSLRLLMACGLLQAFFMEMFLFTLW